MAVMPQQVDGKYRVLKPLGEGATGDVFLVEGSAGRAALKMLKPFPDRALEERLVSAFKFEFSFLKDLRHPNVVQIHDFGFDEALQRFYFTEEFLQGRPLSEFGPTAAPEILERLFLQALHGLQAIHRAQLLHGDIKANNLFVVDAEGGPQLKLIDLGLADPRFSWNSGTPSTMAPEKILQQPVDARADLYSLGVVFYSLLSGTQPFVCGTMEETLRAQLTVLPQPLTLFNPKVPPYWNEILARLLVKNPAHRFRNAGEVLEAFELARPGRKVAARPLEWYPDRWAGRKKFLQEILARVRTAVKKNETVIFLLSGEPGLGKSRILAELKYQLQLEGISVESHPRKLGGTAIPKVLLADPERFSQQAAAQLAKEASPILFLATPA